MNQVTTAQFFLSDTNRFLWVQLLHADDTSLEAALLGLEMVFPGANVQIDATTRGLIVVHDDMRGWEKVSDGQLNACLRDAHDYLVGIEPGTTQDVVVMELKQPPTYRLEKYLREIPWVNQAWVVDELPRFVHLEISDIDTSAFCQVLRRYMSFGFCEQE